MRTLRSIEFDEADLLADIAFQMAKSDEGDPVSIVVCDVFGELLVAFRMPGAESRTAHFAAAKARQAALTGIDTVNEAHEWYPADAQWKEKSASGHRRDDNMRVADPAYTSFAGGFTITVLEGDTIGGIGISGRPQLLDHALAAQAVGEWDRKRRLWPEED